MDVPVVHPMLIAGELTMLVKVDKKQNEDEPKKQGQSFNLDDEILKLNSLLKGYSAN